MREGWQTKKLGELGKVITGSTPSTRDESNYSSPDVCFVKPSDIAKTGITTISNTEFHISRKAFLLSRKLPQGSVLTTCIGIIGKVGILGVDATCNQQINAIIPDKTAILPTFLAYSILSKQHLLSSIANAPVVPIINKGEFSSVLIPVPPIHEQEKVVAELDSLRSIIEKKKQQLKELDNLAQSIFYDMFGDPISNEKGWEVKRLGEVCEIINGFAFKSQLFREDGGDTILRISNIQDGYVDLSDAAHFNKTDYPKIKFEKYLVLPEDIVVALSGATTGKLGINRTGQKLYLNQRVAICREKGKVISHLYLLYFLKTQSASFLGDAAGVAQPNLSTEQMKTYQICIPSVDVQNLFAQKMEAIEKQKELIKKSIQETETLFNSRMDYWFN